MFLSESFLNAQSKPQEAKKELSRAQRNDKNTDKTYANFFQTIFLRLIFHVITKIATIFTITMIAEEKG